MSEKLKIDSEQVVSTSRGVVTYQDSDGTLKKVAAVDAEIVTRDISDSPAPASSEAETSEPAPEPTPPDEPVPAPAKAKKPPAPKKSKFTGAKKTAPKASPPAPVSETSIAGDSEMATKSAKKKAKSTNKSAAGTRSIGGKTFDLTRYKRSKAPGGGTSYNNGDTVAAKLDGKTLDEVYALAAKTVKQDETTLRKKFKHLNSGMQRMNLGNMMRKVMIPKSA